MIRIGYLVVCLLAGLIVAGTSGCGPEGVKGRPPMAKVKGTVKYKGKPVANAAIMFTMEGAPRSAIGTTDADGNFKLTTFDTYDGAFVGTHKVTVTKAASASTLPGEKTDKDMTADDLAKLSQSGKFQEWEKNRKSAEIPAKYADIKTTPLQSTIEKGENDKNIELED